MDETAARRILGEWIQQDEGLFCLGRYLSWTPKRKEICLDDSFDVEELKAIVWWMENKQQRG